MDRVDLRAAKKLPKNDATYCRLKGWTVGTILTLEYEYRPGRYSRDRIRITAIGDKSILIREIGRHGQDVRREEQWSRTLLAKYAVIDVQKPTEDADG